MTSFSAAKATEANAAKVRMVVENFISVVVISRICSLGKFE